MQWYAVKYYSFSSKIYVLFAQKNHFFKSPLKETDLKAPKTYVLNELKIGKKSEFIIKCIICGHRCEKTSLRGFANNKGAYQSAHLHSLISDFVIHLLESIISRLATSEIAIL